MQNLEDLFVAECRKQGFQPNTDAMRQAAIDLAGSTLTDQGLIAMPRKGAISPKDFVCSLRGFMPTAFGSLSDDKSAGNMTTDMRREIAANRSRSLPSDWHDLPKKYSAGSLTGQMMDELAAARRQGK
jgi:hypothetical protein